MARVADVNVEEADKYIKDVLEAQKKSGALPCSTIFFTRAAPRSFVVPEQCGAASKAPG